MSTVAGKEGNVIHEGLYTAHVHEWSADVEAEALEDTAWQLGSGTPNPELPWRTFISGLKTWSGSYSCFLDTIEVPEVGAIAWLKLYVDAVHWFEGYAMVTGVHPSAPVDGITEATFDFQGTLHMGVEVPTTTTAP
jgi:hypothetical protein